MFPFKPGGKNSNGPYGGGKLLLPVDIEQLPLVAVLEPLRYGEINAASLQTGTSDNQVVLPQSPTRRTLLVIQNIAGSGVWVNFGNAAGFGNGILLNAGTATEAGGSIFFDTMVPQNQVFANSLGVAGAISILYCDQGI